MDVREKVRVFQGVLAGQAVDRYNERYVGEVFANATAGMSSHRESRLVGDALALCGSPYYVTSHTQWSQEAWEFLALFCK